MMAKLIITAALTGGTYGRTDSPYLPVTPDAIADSGIEAIDAGAAIVHIHARDNAGDPVHDVDVFRGIVDSILSRRDVVMNLSTDFRYEGGLGTLELAPEIVSFPCGSTNLGDATVVASLPVLRDRAMLIREAGTKPEIEIFHEGMIGTAVQLAQEGVLDRPLLMQFLLGVPGSAPADPRTLLRLVDSLPEGTVWAATAAGLDGLPIATLALMLGGHVTVGLESQLHYGPGVFAISNAQLVERVVRLAREFGREIATPEEARRMIDLKERIGRRRPAKKGM